MIEFGTAILTFLLAGLFFATWFLTEEKRYKEGKISPAVYYGVGLGVGGALTIIAILVLVWAIHENKKKK